MLIERYGTRERNPYPPNQSTFMDLRLNYGKQMAWETSGARWEPRGLANIQWTVFRFRPVRKTYIRKLVYPG
jgi:hypothetical protein